MTSENNALWEDVKESLGSVPSLDKVSTAKVNAILYKNYKSGRIKQVITKENIAVSHYVQRVVRIFKAQHETVVQIQIRRDDSAWETLHTRLYLAIYGRLKSAQLHSSERKAYAQEYAQEATFGILRSHYPYDIDFMRWAYKIVFNTYAKGARHSQTQMRQAERYATSLEDWQETLLSPLNVEQRVAAQYDLVDVLMTLTRNELAVLKQLVEGYSQNEIAERTVCSASTISRMKKRIREKVMKIIDDSRYNDLHESNRTAAADF